MERRTRHSLFFPLLLIAVGVVFLLDNLNLIAVDGWELILRLWPVLLIVGGLDYLYQGRGWTWGAFLLLLGGVFLLANFGYLPLGGWDLLLRLWPVFLIALGLDLIVRERPAWASALAIFLVLLLLGGIMAFALTQARLPANTQTITYPRTAEVRELQLEVFQPLGRLEISAATTSRMLVEGEITQGADLTLTHDLTRTGSTAVVRLSAEGHRVVFPWSLGPGQTLWRLGLPADLPIQLHLRSALGEQVLDLSNLQVTQLSSEVALGSLTVTLPARGALEGSLKNPMGFTTINVPREARLALRVDRGLASVSMPADFTQVGDMYFAPDTTSTNARLYLTVEQPMGGLRVRYLP
jgi:hypothetical protein